MLISLARDFESAGHQAPGWEGDSQTEFQLPERPVQ